MRDTVNIVFIPFEIKPCSEHGYECGGEPEPRFDLPVFTATADAANWMTQIANQHIHRRNGAHVVLNWIEHTREEALALGFKLSSEVLH